MFHGLAKNEWWVKLLGKLESKWTKRLNVQYIQHLQQQTTHNQWRHVQTKGEAMNIGDFLRKKRDGGEYNKEEIDYFTSNLVKGHIADAQIGAALMAMYIRGLSAKETVDLTRAMVLSGEQLQWDPKWNGLLADKHSTGGIGDKISLILAPIMAACGLKVPMVSGRSLEHTGGTLDKLESIPGFVVDLDKNQMHKALETAGCFIAAATKNLCPADRILYRARDLTSTVDSTKLIATSIISKKVASGTKFLIVDVKVGKAAFCKSDEIGRALGKDLIRVSAELGVVAKMVLTRMDEPLGRFVGNALEVVESVQCLSGDMCPQIARVINVLGVNLLQMTKLCKTEKDGEQMIQKVIKDGSAMDHFHRMCLAQGVSKETISKLEAGQPVLPAAKYSTEIKALESGWVSSIDGLAIGQVCQFLGASRHSATSVIDHAVGVQVHRRVSEKVSSGEVWLTVYHSSSSLPPEQKNLLTRAISISPSEVKDKDIVIEVIHQ